MDTNGFIQNIDTMKDRAYEAGVYYPKHKYRYQQLFRPGARNSFNQCSNQIHINIISGIAVQIWNSFLFTFGILKYEIWNQDFRTESDICR